MIRIWIALSLFAALVIPAAASEIGDDGLHKEPWFAITFRDIAEDIETAREQNKRLVLIFEQRGCIYCREVHENVLSDPAIREYLEEHYMIVQYNLYGDEEVVDLDGEELTEKTAARKWGLLFTPTLMFMPEEPVSGKNAKEAAVASMPGAFKKGTFLDLFTWINEKGYEGEEGFQAYHARRIRERSEAGEVNTD
jgi:thioredoxin-related protein